MRTLGLNKTKIWYTNVISTSEQVDLNGHYTGVTIDVYGTPVEDYMMLYPANGDVVTRLFGKSVDLDMVAVSESIVLTKDTLIFTATPVAPYFDNADYTVDKIARSINFNNYGLKKTN